MDKVSLGVRVNEELTDLKKGDIIWTVAVDYYDDERKHRVVFIPREFVEYVEQPKVLVDNGGKEAFDGLLARIKVSDEEKSRTVKRDIIDLSRGYYRTRLEAVKHLQQQMSGIEKAIADAVEQETNLEENQK